MKALRAILLFICIIMMAGCTSLKFALVNLPSAFTDVKIEKDIAYGPGSRQKLDIYTPKHATEKTPIIVFFYGGRWSSGSKDQYRFIGLRFAEYGYKVIIPDYSLYPEVKFPKFVSDGARAIAWTSDNVKGPIYVLGHSAGAHIGSLIAANPVYLSEFKKNRSLIRAFAGLAGPYDFIPEDNDLKDMFGPPQEYWRMQTTSFIDGSQPPMLLLHGRKDQHVIVRNLERLRDKIKEKGGIVETKIYPDLDHIQIIGALSWIWHDRSTVGTDIISFFRAHK